MRKLSIILVLLWPVLGCMTQRRATNQLEKIQKKHPVLFSKDTTVIDSSRIDTIAVIDTTIIEASYIDSAVVKSLSEIIEELTLENKNLKVTLTTTPNIETNTRTWELKGVAKADTIYKIKKIPIRQIIYKRMPATPCEVVKGAPWWYYVLFALGGALFTYLGLKKGGGIPEVIKGFLKMK